MFRIFKDGLSNGVKKTPFPPRGQPSRQRRCCMVCAGVGGAGVKCGTRSERCGRSGQIVKGLRNCGVDSDFF